MLLTDDALVLNLSARSKRGVFIVIFINVINSWSVKEMKDGLHPSMFLTSASFRQWRGTCLALDLYTSASTLKHDSETHCVEDIFLFIFYILF